MPGQAQLCAQRCLQATGASTAGTARAGDTGQTPVLQDFLMLKGLILGLSHECCTNAGYSHLVSSKLVNGPCA